MEQTRVNILGIKFDNMTASKLINSLIKDSQQHRNRFVVTANPEIVLKATHDPHYQAVINHADYITADGIGIIKGARILGTKLPERVTGYDTMIKLLDYANRNHKSCYFLGAKSEVIKTLEQTLPQRYPQLKIAGMHDGYFKDDEQVTQQIATTNPNFVFVALGFPKQDFFISKHRQISDSIWMGVGGSFDVLAGNVKRAPQFWINHHLEWLYRLITDPRRFGRMLALPQYLIKVYCQKFSKK